VNRWADTVLRIGYTWTGNSQDAQDICQTVLLKLLTASAPAAEVERAWVIRVAINCCKDWKKSAWNRRSVPLESAPEETVCLPDTEDTPILQMVQTLPENYRQAIYLRYYEEYELDEIAALMGCKTAQVSTYLYRGRAKLKTMLGGNYGQKCLSE
jgi:RNA polymerase sigma-70 factor (ECF subfamily)